MEHLKKLAGLALITRATAQAFQIQSQEINKCLTFSKTKTMASYDPMTEHTSAHALVVWENCQANNDDQIFEMTLNGQIKTAHEGKCLTALPIEQFHGDLDGCDTWNWFMGAGTYLFAMECRHETAFIGTSKSATSQKFTYDATSKTLRSKCGHQLNLGGVQANDGNYKAFLTSDTNTFPSAMILSGFDVNQQQSQNIEITQKRQSAMLEVLSEFLEVDETVKLSLHGCWCTRILGYNPRYVGEPVDEIDHLCKEWASRRRCNTLFGGTCHLDSFLPTSEGATYTMLKSLDQDDSTFSCETDENGLDDCLKDSCLIDATYAKSIKEALKADATWVFKRQSLQTCSRVEDPLGPQVVEMDHSRQNDAVCVGIAPNLSAQRL